jgi:hypothetical protein
VSLRLTESANAACSGAIGLVNGEQPGLGNPSVIELPTAGNDQAIGMAFAQESLPAPFADFAIENHAPGIAVEPKTDGGSNRAQWTRAICRRRMPLHAQILPLNWDVRFSRGNQRHEAIRPIRARLCKRHFLATMVTKTSCSHPHSYANYSNKEHAHRRTLNAPEPDW